MPVLLLPSTTPSMFTIGITYQEMKSLSLCSLSLLIKPYIIQELTVSPGCCLAIVIAITLTYFLASKMRYGILLPMTVFPKVSFLHLRF